MGCIIRENSTPYDGGAAWCESSFPILSHCLVERNDAGNAGGGFDFHRSDAIFRNCVITANVCRRGGLFCHGSSPSLTNCTITNNIAAEGAALYSADGGTPNLTNCILWGNSDEQISYDLPYSAPIVTYSSVEGGWPGEGNIDADPGFRSVGPADWLLRPGSRCIDAGAPTVSDGISDSHPLWPEWYPNGARSDMGAFGGPGNVAWLGGRF